MIDMNLSREWAPRLKNDGHRAVHWSEIGRDDDDDVEIMAWAATHDHVVLTADLDFGEALARSGRDRPSVVQIRHRETRPAYVGAAVIGHIRASEADLGRGALLTIGSRRTRVRRLPLGV